MTAPIFNLGDEVERENGKRFRISRVWKRPDGSFAYSDTSVGWIPASELKLVNKAPLSSMWLVYNYETDDPVPTTIRMSCPCGREAEIVLPEKNKSSEVPTELKIGDWVEVIRPDLSATGQIMKVTRVEPPSDDKYNIQLDDKSWWRPVSLRKLTPEEIEQHTAPKLELSQEAKDKIRALVSDAITGKSHIGINERLSSIEKQLGEQQEKISQFNGEIGHLIGSIQECLMESGDVEARTKCREMQIEKRLAFVEKFQRDQDDLIGRAIRDGAVEISDFRRSG